jgi:hypothetical protein
MHASRMNDDVAIRNAVVVTSWNLWKRKSVWRTQRTETKVERCIRRGGFEPVRCEFLEGYEPRVRLIKNKMRVHYFLSCKQMETLTKQLWVRLTQQFFFSSSDVVALTSEEETKNCCVGRTHNWFVNYTLATGSNTTVTTMRDYLCS